MEYKLGIAAAVKSNSSILLRLHFCHSGRGEGRNVFPVTHKDLLLCELMSFGCLSDSDHSTHKEPVFTHSGGKAIILGEKRKEADICDHTKSQQ